MWNFVDFLPKIYWGCKPNLTESLNVLLYNEIRSEAWDTYLQHLKEPIKLLFTGLFRSCASLQDGHAQFFTGSDGHFGWKLDHDGS
jgi:hypothetical protein